jgi:hypothetical protein
MILIGAASTLTLGEISNERLRPYSADFCQVLTTFISPAFGNSATYIINAYQWNWGYKTGLFYLGIGSIVAAGAWHLILETDG